MATIRLTLTEDHLKLIRFFFIQENDNEDGIEIDSKHLYNLGSHLLEDMATILGMRDKMIPNTINDAEGAAFEDEAEEYMLSLHKYLQDNIVYIETLVHQFVTEGLKPGTYECKSNELLWKFVD